MSIIKNVKNVENIVSTICSSFASNVSTYQETTKMSEIAFRTTISEENRNKSSAIYHGEIENNQKCFDRNSIEIRENINCVSTVIRETPPSAAATTQSPSMECSSASSIFHDYFVTILKILAVSLSIKFFVNTD